MQPRISEVDGNKAPNDVVASEIVPQAIVHDSDPIEFLSPTANEEEVFLPAVAIKGLNSHERARSRTLDYRGSNSGQNEQTVAHGQSGTSSKPDQEVPKKSLPALDGGWGWMCVVGCAFMHFLLGGYGRSFGVVYVKMLDKFDCSAAMGSTIGGLFTAFRMGCGPLVSALTKRFSVQAVTVVGALVFSTGAFLCCFAMNPAYMLVTYSVISGIGGALVYFPAIVIVGQYFDRRRGVAMGLSTAGSGVGCVLVPPLYRLLFDTYGFQGTFIIVSAIMLNFLVCALLYRPLADTWRGVRLRRRMKDREASEPLLGSADAAEETADEDVFVNARVERPRSPTFDLTDARPSPVDGTRRRDQTTYGSMTLLNETASLPARSSEAISWEFVRHYSDSDLEHATWSTRGSNVYRRQSFTYDPRSTNIGDPHGSEHQALLEPDPTLSQVPLVSNTSAERPLSCCARVNRYLNCALLLNPAFACYVLALGLATMAYMSAQNLILAHALEIGVPVSMSVYILSIIGVADTLGRVASGFLYDVPCVRRVRNVLFVFILFGSGLSILGWAFCDNFIELAGLSVANGLFNGAIVTGRPVIVADLVGIDNMSAAFGMTVFFQGVCIMIGPLVAERSSGLQHVCAGLLKDLTGDYKMSYVFTGAASCVGAVIYFLGYRCRCCCDRRREPQQQQQR